MRGLSAGRGSRLSWFIKYISSYAAALNSRFASLPRYGRIKIKAEAAGVNIPAGLFITAEQLCAAGVLSAVLASGAGPVYALIAAIAAFFLPEAFLNLSLIHISEPTRPY